ncbi:MAG: site-specific DNA-methyltransferase [Chthoniobacterales bacterium]
MPTLDWIGKQAVVNHHREVPYRLLRCEREASAGEPGGGNLLVEGDNLQALKALLPYYAGQVKCIYIDPPYNTGNEGWIYNDNVNAPEMQKWLGETVGKEAEDLSRHDKWLCMMYPRLALLHEFLREDGLIFVNIGTDEIGHVCLLLDEIFGSNNRIAVAAWETSYTANQTAKHISETTDFVYIYAKRFGSAVVGKFERSEHQLAKFQNPDNDPRGPWKAENLSAGKFYSAGQFKIVGPTGLEFTPPPGRYWRCSERQYEEWLADSRITFGKKDTGRPMLKKYRDELAQGLTPTTWWRHEDFGTAKDASIELKAIFDGEAAFATPKPTRLVRRILQIATEPGDLILDSFAGSGTTGHAVLALNKEDGGDRRFILCEMEAKIASAVASERLRRVISGYGKIPGLGGSFRYCTLGEPLFDAEGQLREDVKWNDLAHHLWFIESGEPWTTTHQLPKAKQSLSTGGPLIGVGPDGRAIYLLFSSDVPAAQRNGTSTLSAETLEFLAPFDGPRVVYADACTLRKTALSRERIAFKQIPYQIPQQ